MIPLFFIVIICMIVLSVLNTNEKEKRKSFYKFLFTNRQRLMNGESVSYCGCELNANTELVNYKACMSVLVLTFTYTSSYYPAQDGNNDATNQKLLYSILSLFTGWWGIPWGPIKTIQYFVTNIFNNGGQKVTVSELIYLISSRN